MRGDEQINVLRELHAVEVAAEAIYRRQIWRVSGDLKEALVHAAENEKTHKDSLKKRIEELGGKPHFTRYPMYVAGSIMGFVASIFGMWAMMMSNIMFETQAVFDYNGFVRSVKLESESKELLKRFIQDEKDHITAWESFLWEENIELKTSPRIAAKAVAEA